MMTLPARLPSWARVWILPLAGFAYSTLKPTLIEFFSIVGDVKRNHVGTHRSRVNPLACGSGHPHPLLYLSTSEETGVKGSLLPLHAWASH